MKMTKNFYDWCIENNRQDLLDRWDHEFNDKLPQDVCFTSNQKFYFQCDKHQSHKPTAMYLSSLTCQHAKIKCLECSSFAQWIIDHYDEDYLNKIWNNELNQQSPWEITAKNHNIIYLNCTQVDYHKGYKTTPARFTSGQKKCGFCHGLQTHIKDSFAYKNIQKYGEDFLEKYWDYEKNTVDPYNITAGSRTKVFIKCPDIAYHDSHLTTASDFTAGKSHCPYCKNKKIHKLDSVGTIHPEIFNVWSDKNETTPYEYSTNSGHKMWFKCENGLHDDYLRSVRDAYVSGFYCPECTKLRNESFLQEAVRKYINSKYPQYKLNHEFQCSVLPFNPKTGGKMPYDNELILDNEAHLFIEVHGKQHFAINGYTLLDAKYRGITPEESLALLQERDEYKKKYIENIDNYYYMSISYDTYLDDSYKSLIDQQIHKILQC